jgi:hypothetical protein
MTQERGDRIKKIRITRVGINRTARQIMLGQDAHPFGLSDILPAVGESQVKREKPFQRLRLYWETVTRLIDGHVSFGNRVNHIGMPQETRWRGRSG